MPDNKHNIKVFSDAAIKKFIRIHELSRKYNSKNGKNHCKKILSFIKAHAKEIDRLHKIKNSHYIIETGDLLVLCMEIFLETGKDPNKIVNICFKRFESKLSKLLSAKKYKQVGKR